MSEALDLLEKVSEELTDLVIDMQPGTVRGKLVAISENIDDFLFESEEAAEIDEYNDDLEDEDDDTYEDDEDFEEEEVA